MTLSTCTPATISRAIPDLATMPDWEAAMMRIATREAGYYLAHNGLSLDHASEGEYWYATIAEMIDAARAARGATAASTERWNLTLKAEEDRAEQIDTFLNTLPEAARFACAGELRVSLGNDSADAGFCLGVAVALRFMGGAR